MSRKRKALSLSPRIGRKESRNKNRRSRRISILTEVHQVSSTEKQTPSSVVSLEWRALLCSRLSRGKKKCTWHPQVSFSFSTSSPTDAKCRFITSHIRVLSLPPSSTWMDFSLSVAKQPVAFKAIMHSRILRGLIGDFPMPIGFLARFCCLPKIRVKRKIISGIWENQLRMMNHRTFWPVVVY